MAAVHEERERRHVVLHGPARAVAVETARFRLRRSVVETGSSGCLRLHAWQVVLLAGVGQIGAENEPITVSVGNVRLNVPVTWQASTVATVTLPPAAASAGD